MQVKQISDNEIYLLIKYIKSVLWKVAKRLSYIEDAQCLKVKSGGNAALLHGTEFQSYELNKWYHSPSIFRIKWWGHLARGLTKK